MSNPNHKLAVDPACAKALEHLERVTSIDVFSFTSWLKANRNTLDVRLMLSGEDDGEVGAWCRLEYVRALGRIP